MSVLTDIRLAELRFATSALIADKPTTISLVPTRAPGQGVRKPGGGHDYLATSPTPLPPQVFRIDVARQIGPRRSPNDAGKAVEYDYTLLGEHDAVVAIGHTWSETAPDGSNIHYRVEAVDPNNGYETIARVNAFATEPQHG